MSEVTVFTKEELLDALRFEYGEPDIHESIFQSADQIMNAIQHVLAICEKKHSAAPNEKRRLFWEVEIIKRKRRLLLWQMVQDYLDAQDICPVCGEHCQDDIQLYSMCAECHDRQSKTHTCEHCGGQGEVQVHIAGNSWDSNDPGAWQPQRCVHCEGTGKNE